MKQFSKKLKKYQKWIYFIIFCSFLIWIAWEVCNMIPAIDEKVRQIAGLSPLENVPWHRVPEYLFVLFLIWFIPLIVIPIISLLIVRNDNSKLNQSIRKLNHSIDRLNTSLNKKPRKSIKSPKKHKQIKTSR